MEYIIRKETPSTVLISCLFVTYFYERLHTVSADYWKVPHVSGLCASSQTFRSSHRRCSVKKGCSQKFCKRHKKTPVLEFFFKRDFFKKRLRHRCFPVKLAIFLRTLVFKYICERLLLYIQLRLLIRFRHGEKHFFKIVKTLVTVSSKTTLFICIYLLFIKTHYFKAISSCNINPLSANPTKWSQFHKMKLRICSHLLKKSSKKSLMENLIFCAVGTWNTRHRFYLSSRCYF